MRKLCRFRPMHVNHPAPIIAGEARTLRFQQTAGLTKNSKDRCLAPENPRGMSSADSSAETELTKDPPGILLLLKAQCHFLRTGPLRAPTALMLAMINAMGRRGLRAWCAAGYPTERE